MGDLDLKAAGPHFLWVTEFPLFTRADPDKALAAHGRWSSTHHPFTAPMWEDVDTLYGGRVSEVRRAFQVPPTHTAPPGETGY